MSNVFKVLCTVLMAVLILALIWVLINYYKEEPFASVPTTKTNELPVQNIVPEKSNEIIVNNNVEINIDEKTDVDNNVNDVPDENSVGEKIDEKPVVNIKDPVVITSSENTSNTEKQEVLDEIDKALMELFQVVDSVKPVDESRLGVDESEVH